MENISVTSSKAKPSLPLTVGSELLIEIVNLKLRIKSILVGMESGRYLIAKLHSRDLMGSFRSEAVKASPMIIRYKNKGTVYGFRTEILNIVSSPSKLFFIGYPNKIDEVGLAVKSRYHCEVSAQTMLGNDIIEMTIVDVSSEGCLCVIKTTEANQREIHSLVKVDNRLDMMAHLPVSDAPTGITGVVRNVSREDGRIVLGVRFEKFAPGTAVRFNDFLTLLIKTANAGSSKGDPDAAKAGQPRPDGYRLN